MTQEPLSGQIALVTGASRGLGAACAEWLAGQGAHVVAVARTIGALEELDDRIKAKGGQATLAPMDLTEEGAIAHLCGSIQQRWGRTDIWVHTMMHATALTPAPHIQPKDLDKVIATNIRATVLLMSRIEPLITAARAGQAIFFDDRWDEKFAGAYALSKAAQRALVECWRAETRKIGPAVHLLRPNAMPTATRARFYPGEDRSALADPRAEAARLLTPILVS